MAPSETSVHSRKLWTSRLDELSQERNRLERKLAETERHLKTVEASHEKLRTKLGTKRRAPARKPARRLIQSPASLRRGRLRASCSCSKSKPRSAA